MLSTEELLKPRYKVIADYPNSDYHTGEILDRDWGFGFKHKISDYPHLFKRLFWWQEREENDMPEYVKIGDCMDEVEYEVIKVGGYCEYHFHEGDFFGIKYKNGGGYITTDLLPATREEYEQYHQSKKYHLNHNSKQKEVEEYEDEMPPL